MSALEMTALAFAYLLASSALESWFAMSRQCRLNPQPDRRWVPDLKSDRHPRATPGRAHPPSPARELGPDVIATSNSRQHFPSLSCARFPEKQSD